jgi:Fe-S-cluster containining protein
LWGVKTGQDGFCAFFEAKGKSCAIHPVKPFSCRSWPYFWALVESREAFLEAQNICPALSSLDYQNFLAGFKLSGRPRPPRGLKKALLGA